MVRIDAVSASASQNNCQQLTEIGHAEAYERSLGNVVDQYSVAAPVLGLNKSEFFMFLFACSSLFSRPSRVCVSFHQL